MAKNETNKNYISKLKQQRKVVGLLRFETRDDANFSKWYSLTENLVIKSFGEKSNQVLQFRTTRNKMPTRHYLMFERINNNPTISESKQKLKDLLTVFIEELELDVDEAPKPVSRKEKGISMKMNNTQTVNTTIDISVQIKSIIDNIRQAESDPVRVTEAENKLHELEAQMKSSSPVWSTIKDILIWLLNFGRDTFLQALPIILQKYNN